jgi:acyl-CoA hydrolase
MLRPLPPEAVAEQVLDGDDLIVPLANGEPVSLLDAVEAAAAGGRLRDVRVHQMHALHDRPSIRGELAGRVGHVSYFLSHITRPAFLAGQCELVPNHFSEVPLLLRSCTKTSMVLAASSPMDAHGYFSLGTNADYVAGFIGRVPFWLEANHQMPRSFGRNQVHVSQVLGWTEVDRPLVEVPPVPAGAVDRRIAELVAERVPNGACLQVGIGGIPNAMLDLLADHRDLGLHTELLSDGVIDLVDAGALTGTEKKLSPNKMVATFALGTRRLYDFLHENAAIELLPVEYVNSPRTVAREPNFVSVNATLEVDFLGQCASETLAGRYYSSSGGQSDFARGAMYSEGGQGFIVLHSTTSDGRISRIRSVLTPGSAVTTNKNTVDHVVTEWGVAHLRGRSIRERTRLLIGIAHPDFRDALSAEAKAMGYL